MANKRQTVSGSIPITGDTSTTITVPEGKVLVGIEIYANWTGASISFLSSYEASNTPLPVYNAGSLYSIAIPDVACSIAVNPDVFLHARFIQLKSALTEAAARTILFIFAEV